MTELIARGDRGAGLVEYALLLVLVALACIGAIQYFGTASANSLQSSCEEIVAGPCD